jgi:hypothetical protein
MTQKTQDFVTLKGVFAVHYTGTMVQDHSGATTTPVTFTKGAPAPSGIEYGTPSRYPARAKEIIRFRQPMKSAGENP